mgnify:CR=1 FL=1
MMDEKCGYKTPTPADSLEQQIIDPSFPKNEREWWAAEEITRLRADVEALRAAPQQAEPVGYFVNDESDDQWHQVDYEQRNGADTYPLYLHPPADEVQRLRDALRVILEADWTSDRIRNIARKALEGGA